MVEIVHQAELLEKEYDWVGAAESYEKALNLLPENDFSRMGHIHERLGYAFYRAAMQAESQEEFRERMQRAIEAYEKAHGCYEEPAEEPKVSWMFRCKALVKYLGYWLTPVPSEKRKLLDECLELEGKTLEAFLESGDMLEYGKIYNELSLAFFCRFYLEWDRQTAESIVKREAEWGEKAVAALSQLGNPYEIAGAHLALATCLAEMSPGERFIAEPEEIEKNRLKVVKYLSKTAELSERLGDAYLLGSSHLWWGNNTGGEEAVKHFEKTIECGKLAKDNFLIAWGSDFLASMTYWKAIATEDPEKRREMAEEAMRFYDEGQLHFSVMSYASPRYGVIAPPAGYAEYYWNSAVWETDSCKKLEFLEKSEKAGIQALKDAEASDMPRIVLGVFHVLSKTLEARARVEPETLEKRSRLERALKYRGKTIEILDQLAPFDYWGRGIMQSYLAEIKALLAEIEPNLDKRRRLLEEAVLSKEECIELCSKIMPYYERAGDISQFATLRTLQDSYVKILTWLYDLTNNQENLRKAIEASQKAIESASKLEMFSRMAESYWKMAQAQEVLGEHVKAAESFKRASECYMKAAEKIPQLKSFYQDHAVYMQAWTEIEKARHHHERQEYGLAKEHFEKTAELHKSLKKWSYFASNYSAWSNVECAEDLSRKEQCEEAIQAFEQAVNLFVETKRSIQNQLSKIEDLDEKRMANSMVNATDMRREYCVARITLEEAKLLDKKGDHQLSSEKYGHAANALEMLGQALESEQERKEMKFISVLANAWEKMAKAKAEESPQHYAEASRLFETAKDLGQGEQMKALVLGHSRFCMALEAGARFADTRDIAEYARAMQYLESASGYYLKADFQSASDYVKATRSLFDAYVQMGNAARETDLEKRSRLYMVSEEILKESADSYAKAGNPSGKEQAQKLFETAKEQRELSVSLAEVLHAPIVASTTVFAPPAPTSEKAVGLERFEHAEVNANVILNRKELKVGESLDLEIELANAGKGQALLTQIENAVPEGFELAVKPELYRVEGCNINMKGKRLDPLKAEEVRFSLTSRHKGSFTVGPRIVYLDENGNARSHQPEPITITVKELGIKGWLKGER